MQEEKSSVLHFDLLIHLLCYVISFFGLYGFYIISSVIFNLFPVYTSLSETTQGTILTAFSYFLTAVALVIYLWNFAIKNILNQYANVKNILYGFLFGLGLIVGSSIVSRFFSIVGVMLGVEVAVNENEESIREITINMPILTAFMTIVLAPFTEEIGYRLGIFGGIHKYSRFWAYVVASLVFALIHTNLASENILNELLNLPSYIFAGAWLCFTYEKSGSIVTSITAHMTNNGIAFILSILAASLQ